MKNRDTCFWVAEATSHRTRDREIVGTIAITHKRSLSSSTSSSVSSPGQHQHNNSKKIAWLRRMVVKKRFRRMGIAKRLVTTAIAVLSTTSIRSDRTHHHRHSFGSETTLRTRRFRVCLTPTAPVFPRVPQGVDVRIRVLLSAVERGSNTR